MSALHLADGPAMYFGGSIMTFALPYGAFIVIATVLFYLYRRPHSGPRLKYLSPGPVTSVMTREPVPVPATTAAPGTAVSPDEAAESHSKSDPSDPEGGQ